MMPAASALAEKFPSVAIVRSALALLYSYLGEERVARHELDYLAENDFADLHRDWTWLPNLAILAEVCAFLADGQRAAKLYDLSKDIGEEHDLAAMMPDKVRELQARWDEWNKDNVPPLWGGRGDGTQKKAGKKKAQAASN